MRGDPDLLELVLRRLMSRLPQLTPAQAVEIETEIRTEYGGTRVSLPKRRKHLTPEERQKVYQAALGNASMPDIVSANRVSRATVHRVFKEVAAELAEGEQAESEPKSSRISLATAWNRR